MLLHYINNLYYNDVLLGESSPNSDLFRVRRAELGVPKKRGFFLGGSRGCSPLISEQSEQNLC